MLAAGDAGHINPRTDSPYTSGWRPAGRGLFGDQLRLPLPAWMCETFATSSRSPTNCTSVGPQLEDGAVLLDNLGRDGGEEDGQFGCLLVLGTAA
jgi:hypothetical protein